MTKPTDITITNASFVVESIPYQRSFAFGGNQVKSATSVKAEVIIETRNGKHAVGFAQMPLGQQWAWPSKELTTTQTEQAMLALVQKIFDLTNSYSECNHPLEISYHLSAEHHHLAKVVSQKLGITPIPELAVLVCASALDAAIFDAYGRVHGQVAYHLLGKDYVPSDLSEYLDDSFKGEYLDQYISPQPTPSLTLCHTIGIQDPLTPGDVKTPFNDGYPEHLQAWIEGESLRYLKVKLTGNPEQDIDRLLNIDKAAAEVHAKNGVTSWQYSVDANEHYHHVDDLEKFLLKVKEKSPACFERIHFVEQPFSRETWDRPEFNVAKLSAIRPLIIDESLTDFSAVDTAKQQGYLGIAIKTCKGTTESLLMVAAAKKAGLFYAMQDLTLSGQAFLHAAAMASYIPGLTVIESNGRQFCPHANKPFLKSFGHTLVAHDGVINTSMMTKPGLGF
jgi:L-alanine-DL-glutamate epimerase-like enolase superfamily enzyme